MYVTKTSILSIVLLQANYANFTNYVALFELFQNFVPNVDVKSRPGTLWRFFIMALVEHLGLISDLIRVGKTYMEVSAHLQNLGVHRGASEANIRKFCSENGVNHRSGSMSNAELNDAVDSAVQEVSVCIIYISWYGRNSLITS